MLCSHHLLFFSPKSFDCKSCACFCSLNWFVFLGYLIKTKWHTYPNIFIFPSMPYTELVPIFSTFIILPNHRIYFFTISLFETWFYYLVPLLQLIYSSWIVAVFHLRENSTPLVVQVISYQSTQCGTLELSRKFIYKHFEDPTVWSTLHIAH